MSTLASINLNKRLNSQAAKARIGRWFTANRVQFLFAQEPWRSPKESEANLIGLQPVGGNEKVFAWTDSRLKLPKHELVESFWQRVELGYLVVYNIYLDAYLQSKRASQLDRIRRGVTGEEDRPLLIVGDFNLAPNPTDGLYDTKKSTFNSKVDREPFRRLLEAGRLIDLGSHSKAPRWTVERELRGKKVQFRCDLALASDYIASELEFHCDHSPRTGKESFTDHSALVIDVPVTIPEVKQQLEFIPRESAGSIPIDGFKFKPEKTAINRRGPSPIARKLMAIFGHDQMVTSILDYGCGYGADVRFYRQMGLPAEGYDPFPPFGWSGRPEGVFDLVTLIFVLNVLPDPGARLRVLKEAAEHLSPHGTMAIVTRSGRQIQKEAQKKTWPIFNDGYWSHKKKGTFQKGLSRNEILLLAKRAGLELSPHNPHLAPPPGTTSIVLQRDASAVKLPNTFA